MMSKIWFLNLLLVIGIAFFGFRTYKVWNGKENAIAAAIPSDSHAPAVNATLLKSHKLPESAYHGITRRNLFSPDRKPYAEQVLTEEAEPEAKQVQISGRKIILYGVILMDSYRAAFINNPLRKAGDSSSRWIKEGETLGNFEVAAIHEDHVVFREGKEKIKVLLYDKNKSKSRRTATAPPPEKKQPTVVTSAVEKTKKARPEAASVQEKKPVKANPFFNPVQGKTKYSKE